MADRVAELLQRIDELEEEVRYLKETFMPKLPEWFHVMRSLDVPPRAAQLLVFLIKRGYVTREGIREVGIAPNDEKVADVYVMKLRRAFSRLKIDAQIDAVWGKGFRLSEASKRAIETALASMREAA